MRVARLPAAKRRLENELLQRQQHDGDDLLGARHGCANLNLGVADESSESDLRNGFTRGGNCSLRGTHRSDTLMRDL
jgi:hypothetical protein